MGATPCSHTTSQHTAAKGSEAYCGNFRFCCNMQTGYSASFKLKLSIPCSCCNTAHLNALRPSAATAAVHAAFLKSSAPPPKLQSAPAACLWLDPSSEPKTCHSANCCCSEPLNWRYNSISIWGKVLRHCVYCHGWSVQSLYVDFIGDSLTKTFCIFCCLCFVYARGFGPCGVF